MTTGRLAFTAPTALVETAISAVPTATLGARWQVERRVDLEAVFDLGLGAKLEVPGTSATLDYNLQQLQMLGYYRFSPDASRDGLDLRVGLGLHATRQSVAAQNPALLVGSVVAGPALDVAADKHLLGRRLTLSLRAGAEVPFYVRETPRDSGDPGRFYGFGGGAAARLEVARPWGLVLRLDAVDRTVVFRGEGTRAGGTEKGRTHDRFLRGALLAEYAL